MSISAGDLAQPRPTWMSASADAADHDAALVQAAADGDGDAFGLIVDRHQRAVYAVCYRFAGNHEDARDLTQEVFLRAYRALRTFKARSSLGTWLYRIAVNTSLNRVQARRVPTDALLSDRHLDAQSTAPDAELVAEERRAAVRAAIAQLPPRQRATLILRVYQELPHEEIARALGSSVGAVKANFFHALRNLRRALEGRDLA
jgi:RNA polymerase sigma-70 factor (ECF subfamily)